MKHQLKNNYEYKKIIIIKNIKKSLIKKSTSTINTENITQKNKKYDENFKNQNIMLKKKNIINISTHKIQKRQKCVFNHNAQISK